MRALAAVMVAGASVASLACSRAPAPPDAFVNLDAPARTGAGPGGGHLDDLIFAVVGDTRPTAVDDTGSYPTSIIQSIWAEVAAESPPPAFAISTGDYMFASTTGTQQGPQLDLYLGAAALFTGAEYHAMGNHECTGNPDSNCGPDEPDGETANYRAYLARMVAPIGESKPYFVERFAATDGSWTAKLVFVAANAWDATQAGWLDRMLREPTTYTFVIRHEPSTSTTVPGVVPSDDILADYPCTLKIVGHIHEYEHVGSDHEIIVGNGGAPLVSDTNYGYVMIARQPDGTIAVTSYDFSNHAVVDAFAVTAGGEPAGN